MAPWRQPFFCSGETSWIPNKYSHRNKNSYPSFLDESYAAADRALHNAAHLIRASTLVLECVIWPAPGLLTPCRKISDTPANRPKLV